MSGEKMEQSALVLAFFNTAFKVFTFIKKMPMLHKVNQKFLMGKKRQFQQITYGFKSPFVYKDLL